MIFFSCVPLPLPSLELNIIFHLKRPTRTLPEESEPHLNYRKMKRRRDFPGDLVLRTVKAKMAVRFPEKPQTHGAYAAQRFSEPSTDALR